MSENYENEKSSQYIDLLAIIEELKEDHKKGNKPRKLDRETRMACAVHFLNEGLTRMQTAQMLGIARSTLHEDEKKIQEKARNSKYYEAVGLTAFKINGFTDTLYNKAMASRDYRLALDIQYKRIEKFQQLGLIEKVPEKLEIDDGRTRTKEEVIEAITQRLTALPEPTRDSGEGNGDKSLPAEL